MIKFGYGDLVKIRFNLWDNWLFIESVNRTIFGRRYIATAHWVEGEEVITFRRWRIKAWKQS